MSNAMSDLLQMALATASSVRQPCGCGDAAGTTLTLCVKEEGGDARSRRTASHTLAVNLLDYELNAGAIHRAIYDVEGMASAFQNHETDVSSALKELREGRLDLALAFLSKAGLDEAELEKRGGAFIGLILIAAVALVLLFPTKIAREPAPVSVDQKTHDELRRMGVLPNGR